MKLIMFNKYFFRLSKDLISFIKLNQIILSQ